MRESLKGAKCAQSIQQFPKLHKEKVDAVAALMMRQNMRTKDYGSSLECDIVGSASDAVSSLTIIAEWQLTALESTTTTSSRFSLSLHSL
jgi:hypothetical protein